MGALFSNTESGENSAQQIFGRVDAGEFLEGVVREAKVLTDEFYRAISKLAFCLSDGLRRFF